MGFVTSTVRIGSPFCQKYPLRICRYRRPSVEGLRIEQVGAFLGGLRSAADDARSSLTRALEVEALEEEYNKTISAFQSGYRDGVSGKAVKDETGGDNAEEDSTSVENKSDEEQPTTHTDQTSEIDLESIAVDFNGANPAADESSIRFRNQMQRLNDKHQVPPVEEISPVVAEDSSDLDEDMTSVELEYLNERTRVELESLDRKYVEMKRRILERKANAKKRLE